MDDEQPTSAPSYEEQLRTVINFLNTEGLYAAQEALLQELQNRLPPDEDDGPGSSHSGSQHSDAPPSQAPATTIPTTHEHPPPPSESATTSSVGAYHSRQHSTDSGLELGIRLANPVSPTYLLHRSTSAPRHGNDVDEYADDGDPGYVREVVREQDAFVTTEIVFPDSRTPGSSMRHSTAYSSHSSPRSNTSPHTATSSRPASVPTPAAQASKQPPNLSAPPPTRRPAADEHPEAPCVAEEDDEAPDMDHGEPTARMAHPDEAGSQASEVSVRDEGPPDEGVAQEGPLEGHASLDGLAEPAGDAGATAEVPDLALAAQQASGQLPDLEQEEDFQAAPSKGDAAGGLPEPPSALLKPLSMFGKLFSSSTKATSSGRVPKQQRSRRRDLTSPLLGEASGGSGTAVGGGEASFSFPLTPAPKAQPPEPVFPSWPSFKSNDLDPSGVLGGSVGTSPAASRSSCGGLSASRGGSYPGSPDGTHRGQHSQRSGALQQSWPGARQHSKPGAAHKWQQTGRSPTTSMVNEGVPTMEYDEEAVAREFDVLQLAVYHRRGTTGFEEAKELSLAVGSLVAGRYQVLDFLGSAAFSNAVQAADLKTGGLVCLKIVKNNKDYLDQSLDEIKLLRYVNAMDPDDSHGILRLYDFFYFKEHLILVTELLRANLYEFQKYNRRQTGQEPYFTLPRMQKIAIQVLRSLSFLHSLNLIHSDLKPENILIKSYSRCEVKVIDLGSSCFVTDRRSSYVQSRSYRAPEVVLGLPYGPAIDIWSLGCVMAELASGHVLFQNESVASMVARMEGILGPLPDWMVAQGRYAYRIFTRHGLVYERNPKTGLFEVLRPKRTTLAARLPAADEGMLDFIECLLHPDPNKRPSAEEALQHPWLAHQYPDSV